MVSVFDFTEYRTFLNSYIKALPKSGHGFKLKIADALSVHPTLITQVLKGLKSFTFEQAFALSQFIEMSDLEKDYFLNLVEFDRSGTAELKSFIQSKLLKLKQESDKAKNRVGQYAKISEADQALFYSQWYYSAIRLSCAISDDVTVDSLSKQFQLPKNLIKQVVRFLVGRGLLLERADQTLERGPQNTFLPADSPMVSRHHMNWRMKAMEKHSRLDEGELAFSAPLTLAEKDIPEVKKICLEAIQQISKKVSSSKSEKLACLNIDWFLV